MRKITILIYIAFAILISTNLLAVEPSPSQPEKTIKFFIKPQNSQNLSATNIAKDSTDIPISKIQNFIRDVRATVCSVAKNSDVKVWIKGDAEVKPVGIGIAAESGIEITFHCK